MAIFYYEASDIKGKIQKHSIEADSLKHARSILQDKGLFVLDIKLEQDLNKNSIWKQQIVQGVSKSDITDFTRQFATLLDSGLPIDQILGLLSKESDNKNLQQILSQIKSDINGGISLSKAFEKYPYLFSPLYISLVSAGQESGKLNVIMLQIADYLEEQQKLKEQVQHAFTYPIIVSVIAIGIIIYLMINIVPKIVDVFIRNKQDLPFLTEAMIFISDFIRNYGIYCGIGILCLAVIFKQCLKNKKIAYIWHSFIIKLPIAKKLSIGYNSARFSSTLGILTKSGVPILRSLQAGNNTIGNLVLKKEVEQAIEQVKQGNSLASALKDSHFPTIMLHLIKTGESTGKLANMLTKISEQQSQQIRRYTLFLTTLMEPLLVVIMGGVVMLIVLGVLLPIMEINQFIS
ncbi:MAG: hypothetical protein RLZZ210_297 [Pseudomonadota bacterium]|jgi:general secretion pathway protein F